MLRITISIFLLTHSFLSISQAVSSDLVLASHNQYFREYSTSSKLKKDSSIHINYLYGNKVAQYTCDKYTYNKKGQVIKKITCKGMVDSNTTGVRSVTTKAYAQFFFYNSADSLTLSYSIDNAGDTLHHVRYFYDEKNRPSFRLIKSESINPWHGMESLSHRHSYKTEIVRYTYPDDNTISIELLDNNQSVISREEFEYSAGRLIKKKYYIPKGVPSRFQVIYNPDPAHESITLDSLGDTITYKKIFFVNGKKVKRLILSKFFTEESHYNDKNLITRTLHSSARASELNGSKDISEYVFKYDEDGRVKESFYYTTPPEPIVSKKN